MGLLGGFGRWQPMAMTTEQRRKKACECVKRYREKYPDRVRENQRKWRNEHRDALHAQGRRWREAHPTYAREKQLSQYGITIADFEEISEISGGRCWICDSLEKLQVDHNHKTGAIRGFLCHKCNKTLGLFNDDPKLFTRAFKYLSGGNLEGLWGRTKS